MASRVFAFLQSTFLLLFSLSGSRDLCKGVQSIKVCVCERAQVTHALRQVLTIVRVFSIQLIDLYRDVWIAAIASSRTRLATLTGVMCNTSQCELRSLRVNSGMLNVIRIVTYYTLPPLESPDSFWIAMAISR